MEGGNGPYRTMFGDNWGFYLGIGEDLQKIDTPGRWEDLLFAFARDYQTATIVEEISYTLSFYGEGGKMLRRRITGVRGIDSMLLEIRKWNPLTAMWSTYYRGTIDDSTIVVHENYVEASTTPIGVAQDMIAKADEEVTVTMQGKRIVVPRITPYSSVRMVDATRHAYMMFGPTIEKGSGPWPFSVRVSSAVNLELAVGSSIGVVQPYFQRSKVDNVILCARAGTYTISNNAVLHFYLRGRINGRESSLTLIGPKGVPAYPAIPANQTFLEAGKEWIKGGDSKPVILAKGDKIRLWARTTDNKELTISGDINRIKNSDITGVTLYLYMESGAVSIEPVQKKAPLSAPAVRDIDLFAQVCRQITNRPNLTFDFSQYAPSYLSTPDLTPAATFILSLSRLKESEVKDGVVTLQGSNEAYFKGLTLNQFYKYFLAQGYKVAVLQVPDRDGVLAPVITVAPYCNTDWESFYFPPIPNTMVDLGSAVTNIEMARYEHTFLQVVVGAAPQDYGNFPREEGYQDPCNRRITYGIGIENPGDPYEIAMPWGITTFGLEEVLLTFEGENDEARAKRWTDGTAMWIVCGEADIKGQIESITQYGPIAGLYYKPLNLGLRPESLVRRNIPLLCMSLAPFDMEKTFYIVENIEGDNINVESAAASTGDRWLHDYNTKDPIRDTAPQSNAPQSGIFRPVMLTLRSTTGENIYALLHEENTRYGVVRFEYKNKEFLGYLRSAEINPTEQAVQKWELLPIWTQDLTIFD